MKNILIIAQARLGSTRLPGKVMKKVLDKPLLWYLAKRVQQVKTPHKFIIATGETESNQPIIDLAKSLNIDYFIGSEDDVLDRYYQTAKTFKGDVIVRITGDCPLTDPNIIDKGLDIFLNGNYDYVSNVHPPTYPDGFDLEIFSFKALEIAWKEAKLPSEREHVTPHIWKNPEKFPPRNFEFEVDVHTIRLTVDNLEDFELISIIIKKFHDHWDSFQARDIVKYLIENRELLEINSQLTRNEGYLKSLKEDEKFS